MDWLEQGIDVLAREGASGLRIDQLCERLGVTKGSFHHHFAGIADYKRALLGHHESRLTSGLDQAISGQQDVDPLAVLAGLTRMVDHGERLYRPDLEVAVRVWAFSDVDARRTQERIDRHRIEALERVWSGLELDSARVQASALLPYLVAVGASLMLPPVAPDMLRRVYDLLLELIPRGGAAGPLGAAEPTL